MLTVNLRGGLSKIKNPVRFAHTRVFFIPKPVSGLTLGGSDKIYL
jgi:hypothetical protein